MNLIDIEQIEVLRGPQGTLFGKNSVGGAISITTTKPSDELDASLYVRAGNYGAVDTRAMINVPVADNLFARVAFTSNNFDGYHRNTLRGEDLGEIEAVGVLGSLRWLPYDMVTVDLSGQWNRNTMGGSADRCVVAEGGAAGLAPTGFLDACRLSEPYRAAHDLHELTGQENWSVWSVVDVDLGGYGVVEDLSLKSISSWRGGSSRFRGDIDGTALSVVKIAAIGGGDEEGRPTSNDSWMQEAQLSGVAFDDRLKFIVGAFGFWEDTSVPQFTGLALGDLAIGGADTVADVSNWDWAIFSQATADVTDWLSLTGGVRYTQEKKGTVFDNRPAAATDTVRLSGSKVFEEWTPMASVALSAPDSWLGPARLDHLMTYFTYARGFRGGGFNSAPNAASDDGSLPTFNPEALDSFEIGVKTIALDQRFTANLALFHYEYEDIQVLTTEPDSTGNLVQFVRNAAEATGQGVELETQLMPLPGFAINGSVAYIDARYGDFATIDDLTGSAFDSNGDPFNREGETLNNTPRWQTNLGVQFTIPVDLADTAWLQGFLTPRVDWYYQSDEHYAGPEVQAARQAGYNLLNARIAYSFLDDHAQFAIWGKNLTDEEYFSNAQNLASTFGHVLRTYNAPITFGAEVSYRFGPDW